MKSIEQEFHAFGLSIAELIDKRASTTPEAIFIVSPKTGETITYKQLRQSARALTKNLSKAGLVPGDRIAYALTNSPEAALAILGILYGGFIATAVNLVSGSDTISYVLEHSEAKLIITELDTISLVEEPLSGLTIPIAPYVLNDDTFCEQDYGFTSTEISGESDGLLMYTSGTTGQPKGVVLTQSNLIAGGNNTATAHELNSMDRAYCVLPLYHINGLCVTIMGTLVSGGSVVLPNKFSVTAFWKDMANQSCSWFSVVPTQISYLLQEDSIDHKDDFEPGSIRFGRSASAPLSPDVHRAFEKKFKIPIIETMGLTETAAQILSNPLPPGVRKIGSPGIAYGNDVIIADSQQKELPTDEEGEVLVRGINVMRLYFKNKEATNQSLTPEGWLRTGDLGRMDADKYVFITGRLKELIIKGGENIAPREIDEALYSHPDVVEAAAFACPSENYGQRVEAAVMLCAGSKLTETDLINICNQKVGAFKTPDRIHFLAQLPKGPSGKIQRIKIAEQVAPSTENP